MSTFIRNKAGQTPRELAENKDKAKYHRVIKNLKKYETIEIAKRPPEIIEKRVVVVEYEREW